MTAQAHDPSTHRRSRPAAGAPGAPTVPTRLRWLLPALAVGIVAAGLVVAGVVPLSTVLYAGLFGGMILMHARGHGGHGGHGGSSSRLDDRASDDQRESETHDHDQRNRHTCH